MSFGLSIGDAIALTQLASRVVQNSRKACGAHDELTHDLSNLQSVLRRLEEELTKGENPISRSDSSSQKELESLVAGCQKVLRVLENILLKYNSLSEQERSGRKLWQRIRFGNGETQNLIELRGKVTYYTSAISLLLNLISVGSIGRVEKRMDETGGDLREIKFAVNDITAHLLANKDHEGSILASYAEDDKAVWRQFRRELVKDGFSSSVISTHKGLIKAYIKELADRGLLDEEYPGATETSEYEQESFTVPSIDSSTADAAMVGNTHLEKDNAVNECILETYNVDTSVDGPSKLIDLSLQELVKKVKATTHLSQLEACLYNDILPKCEHFVSHPPSNAGHRDDEYRMLSETLLWQVG